jgi:hypothetical protein
MLSERATTQVATPVSHRISAGKGKELGRECVLMVISSADEDDLARAPIRLPLTSWNV